MDQNTKDLTVITTHINADFDAIASLIAAQRLYPDSKAIFPSTEEKNFKGFFIDSVLYHQNTINIKDINISDLKTLVIVDTRQPGRLGPAAKFLEVKGINVHIYDHHPEMKGDIKGDYEVCRETGANITILGKILKEKEIDITEIEATIMCLGLYEDTGSFTFPSTCPEDFEIASFFLSKGADLNMVSSMLDREIGQHEAKLLNLMFKEGENYRINGLEIMITKISSDIYVPDFSYLVQKIARMEDIDALFALALMEDKVHLIARSKVPEINAGEIASLFGGGGHGHAASASMRNITASEAEVKLIKIIKEKASKYRAKDLMSSPPIMIDEDLSCKKAEKILTQYNLNALLVTGKKDGAKSLKGFITRQIVDKAIYHNLGSLKAGEYMNSEIVAVTLDAPLDEIKEKVIENKQRILPVVEDNKIIGVITRTDVFNAIAIKNSYSVQRTRTRNVVRTMEERLSKNVIDILRSIGKCAAKIGMEAYVIGGFVRDLFMYKKNEDIDIVVEGDAILFAQHYAKENRVKLHTHEKFRTAVIIFSEKLKIDIASARSEYYESPAALPTVDIKSCLKNDLYRRDFTINTLAISLNPDKYGTLIDYFGGQKDIKEKALRVLHSLSFVEDPTRIFRVIRFEKRFEFSIGKLTLQLIKNALRMDFVKKVDKRRLLAELKLILEEQDPIPAVKRLSEFGLLKIIDPSLDMDKELFSLLDSAQTAAKWYDLLFLDQPCTKWVLYFMILLRQCSQKTSESICYNFKAPEKLKDSFCSERIKAQSSLYKLEEVDYIKNSELYFLLSSFKTESVLYMMAITKKQEVKRYISKYFTKLRYIKPAVTGQDIKDLGVKPGPKFSEILQAVFKAKLDGIVTDKDAEIAFIKNKFIP